MLEVKVVGRRIEAEGIVAIELAPTAAAQQLPPFTAGAHIDVYLGNGLIRQYSLCNNPADRDRYVIGVLREPSSRGGSEWLHDRVREGDVLAISSPKNLFPLAGEALGGSLLLAGGIGVTPMLAMAEALTRAGENFDLHYCVRTRSRMAFAERIEESAYAGRAHLHLDDGPVEQRFDALTVIGTPASDRHLYVCGPSGFMSKVLETAHALGWPESQLHFEYFSGGTNEPSPNAEFELELRRSGKIVLVRADQSAVEALLEHGVEVPVSCMAGVCGTCLTKVISGLPEHRDLFLSEEEHSRNDCFTPCCSRSRSARLAVDL